MNLTEILLPVFDNEGQPFGDGKFAMVRKVLVDRFGGMTAFARTPAQGISTDRGTTVHDELIVFEVMSEELDKTWWRSFRHDLEAEFRQDKIVIRTFTIDVM